MIPLLLADAKFAGGLLLSATLLGFAAWLHVNERDGWAHEQDAPVPQNRTHKNGLKNDRSHQSAADARYFLRRQRSRNRVHFLFAACGILVLAAAIAGPGIVFVAAWSCVAFAMMVIVVIAMMDGVRTHLHHRDKLPKIDPEGFDTDD